LSDHGHLTLNRLSNHPLQKFFGFMGWDVKNTNTANEMTGTIAPTDIVQETDRALELEKHLHHHVNLAGVHIDDISPHAKTFHLEITTNLDPETMATSAAICSR
jgi:hypothetical protein